MESERKFFRVTFRSNDRLDGTGFNATYHFLDQVESFTGKPQVTSAVPSSNNSIVSIFYNIKCYLSCFCVLEHFLLLYIIILMMQATT